jgi:hypothetical protein
MDISAQMNQVLFPIHPHDPETSLKKCATTPLLPVYRLYIGVEQYIDTLFLNENVQTEQVSIQFEAISCN